MTVMMSELTPTLSRFGALLAIPAFAIAGCVFAPPTASTIPGIITMSGDERSETLVVMLPGRGDRADAFAAAGFELPAQSNGFDAVAVDAHFGYYTERSLIPRLHEDIVLPARERGYRDIWLLGISMGGLGALLYAAEHPDQVDGVVLLAPYLGDRSAVEAVIEAGGTDSLGDRASRLEDYEVDLWRWLTDERAANGTPLLLGYGLDDSMAAGYEATMDLIEPTAIYTREGGHRWTTWRPLWDEMAPTLDSLAR